MLSHIRVPLINTGKTEDAVLLTPSFWEKEMSQNKPKQCSVCVFTSLNALIT